MSGRIPGAGEHPGEIKTEWRVDWIAVLNAVVAAAVTGFLFWLLLTRVP